MNKINLIFVSRLISTIADQLLFFLIPLVVYKVTGSASMSGLSFALEWIPRVVSFLLSGLWGDRIGGSKLYIRTDLLRGVVIVIFVLPLLLGCTQTFWLLTIMGASIGFFSSQSQLSLEMTIKSNFIESDIPKVQAKAQMCEQLSLILGPLFAGALLVLMPYTWLIIISSGLFFIAALISRWVLTDNKEGNHTIAVKRKALIAFRQGYKIIWQSKNLKILVLFSILANFFYGVILALNPAIIKGVFQASDQKLSYMYFLAGLVTIGMLFLSSILTRYLSVKLIGFIGIAIFIVSAILLSGVSSYEMYVLFYVFLISGVMLTNIMTRTYRVKLIPENDFGITVGIIMSVIKTAMPLSGFFVLIFAEKSHLQSLIFWSVIGSVLVFFSLCPFVGTKKVTELNA